MWKYSSLCLPPPHTHTHTHLQIRFAATVVESTLGVQEKLTFAVFLLNNLCNWLFGGKCLSKRSRNSFATFVDTVWPNNSLNQIMFLCLLCVLLFLFNRLYLMEGKYGSEDIIFKCVVTTTCHPRKVYLGTADSNFKQQY